MFENIVVNDFMKFGSNRGEEEQLFFYRDKSQREVDVLRLLSGKLEAYEIKSCKTYSPDLFKNLNYLKTIIGGEVLLVPVINHHCFGDVVF